MADSKQLTQSPNRPVAVTVFFLIALALSCFLAITSLKGGTIAGCGPESSCDEILKSRWAYWLGLPVSLYSAVFYLASLALLWIPGPWSRHPAFRSTALMTIVFLIPGAALWFVGIQWLEFEGFCPYCMSTHAVGVIGAVLLWRHLRGSGSQKGTPAWTPAVGGLIGMTFVLALASGQIFGPAPSTMSITVGLDIAEEQGTSVAENKSNENEQAEVKVNDTETQDPEPEVVSDSSKSKESTPSLAAEVAESETNAVATPKLKAPWERRERLVIRLHRGMIELPVDELPKMGNPDAQHWVVSLFDYTCKHCREMHHDLEVMLEKYGDQVAVLSLPTPLDASCNSMIQKTPKAHENACDYARLGLAVWRAMPDQFLKFDEFIFKPETPPSLSDSAAFAAKLVGADNLQSALKDPWIGKQIQEDISLLQYNYQATGKGQMPQLLIGSALTAGTLQSIDRLYSLVESQFKISPVPAANQSSQ